MYDGFGTLDSKIQLRSFHSVVRKPMRSAFSSTVAMERCQLRESLVLLSAQYAVLGASLPQKYFAEVIDSKNASSSLLLLVCIEALYQ